MTNLEKYNQIFAEVFSAKVEQLNADFDSQHVEGWDSVHQLSLTTAIEDAFDIMVFLEHQKRVSTRCNGHRTE